MICYNSVFKLSDLRPIVDGVANCMHRHRMTANKIAAKINLLQVVELSGEISNLSDVVADSYQKAFSDVSVSKRPGCHKKTH